MQAMPARSLQVVPTALSPVATAALAPLLRSALDGGPGVLPVAVDHPLDVRPLAPELGLDDPTDADTAVVIATSGSTGTPKGVVLTAAAMRHSATATHAGLGGPGHWLLVLSPHHVAGLQVIVRTIVAATTVTTVDPDLPTVQGFLAAASSMPAGERRYVSVVPTQLGRLLAAAEVRRVLAGFDGVLVGGAATAPGLHAAAVAAGIRIVRTYGMSETAGGCVYDGVPLPGVAVDIDGRGAPERVSTTHGNRPNCRPGSGALDAAEPSKRQQPTTSGPVGRVRLAGPTLASGYLRDPVATKKSFAGGWFDTADLGRFRADGRLDIVGRADDVINSGGESVVPALVERALLGVGSVREACVTSVPDPEWGQAVVALVVAEQGCQPDLDAACAAVRAEVGLAGVPKRFHVLDELPMLTSGKVDRLAIAALVAAID